MDYAEFEKWVADYVEGNLSDELRQRMDQARKKNPDLDQLTHLHEQILTALAETPEVAVPECLSRSILAAAEERERMLAQEGRMLRRNLFFWSILAAVITAFASALFYFFRDNLAAGSYLPKAPAWLSNPGNLLTTPVPVPGSEFALPAVYIAAGVILAIVLWCYHELEYTTL
jgi:hypothetical protein